MSKKIPPILSKIKYPLILLALAVATVILLTLRDNPQAYTRGENLLTKTLTISGRKELKKEKILITPASLDGKNTLAVNLNLNGLCVLPAKASLLTLETTSGQIFEVSLHDYLKNCLTGQQTVYIPLTDISKNQPLQNLSSLSVQFWYPTHYQVEINSISAYNNVLGANTSKKPRPTKRPSPSPKPTATMPPGGPTVTPSFSPTPVSTLTPTPTAVVTNKWQIKSVSSMKESKDRVCNQRDAAYIANWVAKAKELGVTHLQVETPYDNPACGDAVVYTQRWVDAIRSAGLSVWHRHMPLGFEGIYNTPKSPGTDYLSVISNYILNNPDFFRSGDIFTPIPEPQNGGIAGVTYCSFGICIFNGTVQFNTWLRDAIDVSANSFAAAGINGVRIGYYGFDGFVAWGDNNPDWNGILEDATVAKMGNITIDHYPEIVGDTMANDLNELTARYPNIPIIVGEWGTITGGDIESQVNTTMQAASGEIVTGFGYWHMGVGGNEALIFPDFSKNLQYDDVQNYY